MMPAGCNKNRAAQMFFQYLWLVCWLGDNWELNWITDAFFARQKWVIIHILLSCSMMLQNTNLMYLCEELIWFFGQYTTTILIKINCVSIQYYNSEIDKHTKINHSICQKDLISEISLWSYCITFVFVKNDGRADPITFCNDEWCMICLLKQEKTLCSPSTQ